MDIDGACDYSGYGVFQLEPITLSGYYDYSAPSSLLRYGQSPWVGTGKMGNIRIGLADMRDGGADMTIGGDTCHLCGEESIFKNTYSKRRKDGSWKTTTVVEYACGTRVDTSPRGKHTVTTGVDCLQ